MRRTGVLASIAAMACALIPASAGAAGGTYDVVFCHELQRAFGGTIESTNAFSARNRCNDPDNSSAVTIDSVDRTSEGRSARAFWEARPQAVAHGVIHAGKFERYFSWFRRFVLPLVQSRAAVEALRHATSLDEQARIYDTRWDHARWRLLFRAFFSRRVMGLAGRDPAFFDHVEGRVGDRILARTRRALTEVPTRDNPYFVFIVTGAFAEGALPRYLREEWFVPIRARLDRLRLEQGPIEEAQGMFAGANLSDVFEYMGPAAFERAYAALLARMRPGGRMVYWNMMAPRARPPALAARARPLEEIAAALKARDRAWFYERVHVDEVIA